MKKTRILAFLITVCMATTSFLGSTIAKYTTNADIEDSATVAKWGIKLTMSGNLFGNAYTNGVIDSSLPAIFSTDDNTISVYNNTPANVVAPGTKGETMTIKLTGTAQVDTVVNVENAKDNSGDAIAIKDVFLKENTTFAVLEAFEGLTAANFAEFKGKLYIADTQNVGNYNKLDANATFDSRITYYIVSDTAVIGANDYNPVKYTLTYHNGSTEQNYNPTVTENLTAQGVYNALNTALNNKSYATNHSFNETYTITWKWEFGTGTEDAADTILGYLASGDAIVVKASGDNFVSVTDTGDTPDYSVSTNFNIKITVDQVN